MKNKVIEGNLVEVLNNMPETCIDAVISVPDIKDHENGVFMRLMENGSPEWTAVMRVAKPGTNFLCLSDESHYDILATEMRLAGAEIRDKIDFYTSDDAEYVELFSYLIKMIMPPYDGATLLIPYCENNDCIIQACEQDGVSYIAIKTK